MGCSGRFDIVLCDSFSTPMAPSTCAEADDCRGAPGAGDADEAGENLTLRGSRVGETAKVPSLWQQRAERVLFLTRRNLQSRAATSQGNCQGGAGERAGFWLGAELGHGAGKAEGLCATPRGERRVLEEGRERLFVCFGTERQTEGHGPCCSCTLVVAQGGRGAPSAPSAPRPGGGQRPRP